MGVAFYRGADSCVLVYDVTEGSSFEHLEGWKNEFLVHAAPRNGDKFPFVVIGNKADITAKRQVSTSQVNDDHPN